MVAVALVALALVGYALLARRLDERSITGPVVFLAIGLLLGPQALNVVPIGFDSSAALLLTELTLARSCRFGSGAGSTLRAG